MHYLLFLSGLALLLFAMKQLEQTLASIGEGYLRRSLEEFTRTPLQGILLGTLTTAILQSSSIVGLMTMAFVGAGVLPLRNAIGVILGSNLGTTFTGWLVTWLGFTLDLTDFYVALLGLGALLSLWGKEENRIRSSGGFLIAFGLLLFGLVLMKDSIEFVLELVDITQLQNFPLVGFFLFGVVLTALIQSSSATMMITLAAVNAGILQLDSAAALVIGADLGTTSTVILGSLSGMAVKRQIALVHFIFNAVTDIAAILSLPLLLQLVTRIYGLTDPLYSLVAIHSTLNLIGIMCFFPALDLLRRTVERWVPLPPRKSLLITQVNLQVPAAALAALETDVSRLLTGSILLNAWRLGILKIRAGQRRLFLAETVQASYAELKHNENQLSDYILELQRMKLDAQQAKRAQELVVCIRDCLYSTKAVKDVEADLHRFSLEPGEDVQGFIRGLLVSFEALYTRALNLLEATDTARVEDFRQMLGEVRNFHTASNAAVYSLIDQKRLRYDRASSALNINRELLLAAHSLINALEHKLVPGEKASTVSEYISQRL